MLLRGYFLLSWLWRLPERMPKIKGSTLLKHGDLGLLREPPKKLTAMQIGKMMLLAAALLGAYEAGTRTNDVAKAVYLQQWKNQYDAWQQRSVDHQKAYAAWAARQPKENK